MTFNLANRRVHLYLAMFLLPWFLMYGISSLPFSHPSWLGDWYKNDGIPQWTERFERPYDRPIPEDADQQAIGKQILKDIGLEGAFGSHRPNERRFNVYLFDFWSATRVTYYVDERRICVEDRRFRWDHFLTGMHARGGFMHESFLHDAWGVVVDIVCVAFLLWIASGIYMWWKFPRTRIWGAIALGGGVASFLVFLLAL